MPDTAPRGLAEASSGPLAEPSAGAPQSPTGPRSGLDTVGGALTRLVSGVSVVCTRETGSTRNQSDTAVGDPASNPRTGLDRGALGAAGAVLLPDGKS